MLVMSPDRERKRVFGGNYLWKRQFLNWKGENEEVMDGKNTESIQGDEVSNVRSGESLRQTE